MQISHPFLVHRAQASPWRVNVRATTAIVVVGGIHAALLAVALNSRDEPVPRAAEARTITAELLRPAPVTPSAVDFSAPAPLPSRVMPTEIAKPKAPHHVTPSTKHATAPLPETVAPSTHGLAESSPVTTASTAAASSTAAAPTAIAPTPVSSPSEAGATRPTIALATPQEISNLHCSIAQPPYPALSRRRNETGSVTVKFVVGLTGQPEAVELKSSSGYSRLDEAALAAVRDSTCRPFLENGAPTRVPTSVPFVFALGD